jgi:hypothetical protein
MEGDPVHANECILLKGLSNQAGLNDREGKALYVDPKQEGRYAVRLFKPNKRLENKKISVKSQNIKAYPATPLETVVLQNMEPAEVEEFFQGLTDRTCKFHLTRPETWSHDLAHLYGHCAVVSYMDQSTDDSPRDWTYAMGLAYRLLAEGGFFVVFGKVDLDVGFLNILAMEGCVRRQGMWIMVETCCDAYVHDFGQGYMLWKKVPPGYDRFAELERRSAGDDYIDSRYWQPEIPAKKNNMSSDQHPPG